MKEMTMEKKTLSSGEKTARLVLTAVFAALTAVMAWISFPLPFTQVPISLSTLGVGLAGGLLGKKYGPLAMVCYVLLGAVGVPVFAEFTAGAGILAGPTGGYIIGYIFFAFLTGLITEKGEGALWITLGVIAGLLVCYALGTLWFMVSTGTGLIPSLGMCVIPFIPGDILKTIVTVLLILRLKPLLKRQFRFI